MIFSVIALFYVCTRQRFNDSPAPTQLHTHTYSYHVAACEGVAIFLSHVPHYVARKGGQGVGGAI